jgi:glycosyltransferase involved in cell wall biosynthesis
MKLAIVTDTFPPDVNGVAMTLERLAAGMIGRGHAVEVIHPGVSGLRGGDGRGRFSEVCVPGFALPRYALVKLGWPRPVFLHRHWKVERPDVLYIATEGLLGYSALRAARKLKISVVSGYHTHFPQYLSGYRLGLLGPLLLRYLRKLHNATASTLVPTEETRRLLISQGFRNVEIMERGVDTGLFHPGRRNRALRERWGAGSADIVMLHVGRVAAEKNLGLVFQAWEAARAQFPSIKLVLAGDGPQRAFWAAKYPEAIWTGFLSGVDLAEAYASADLMLFPSRSETFGNVLLEAMASGPVTVSYHLAASRRFIDPGVNGFAASHETDDAWLRQVLRSLRDRRRWPQVSEAARLTIQDQSWSHVTRVYEHWLRRAAGLDSAHPSNNPLPLHPVPASA